mmetsp:Transcript_49965/g.122698  ORF Transcript_49965/g.122698 Transcript_49965/m.122698 type:complete len:282 (+) Transcript_49965:3-848(+)
MPGGLSRSGGGALHVDHDGRAGELVVDVDVDGHGARAGIGGAGGGRLDTHVDAAVVDDGERGAHVGRRLVQRHAHGALHDAHAVVAHDVEIEHGGARRVTRHVDVHAHHVAVHERVGGARQGTRPRAVGGVGGGVHELEARRDGAAVDGGAVTTRFELVHAATNTANGTRPRALARAANTFMHGDVVRMHIDVARDAPRPAVLDLDVVGHDGVSVVQRAMRVSLYEPTPDVRAALAVVDDGRIDVRIKAAAAGAADAGARAVPIHVYVDDQLAGTPVMIDV